MGDYTMSDISCNESAGIVPVSYIDVVGLENVKEMFQAYGIDSQDEKLEQIPSDSNRTCIVTTRICGSGRCATGIGVVEGQEGQSVGDIIGDARKEAEQDALTHFGRLPRRNMSQPSSQNRAVAYSHGSDRISDRQKGLICKLARKLEQGSGEDFAREMWDKPLDELTRKEASTTIDKLTQIEKDEY